MQPLGTTTIERQAPEQHHPWHRIGRLRQAGSGEVVVDEALRAESSQQALRDTLLEVEVYGIFREHACILENHGPDRGLTTPIRQLLVLLAGGAKRIQGGSPALVSLCAAIQLRELPDLAAMGIVRDLQRLCAEQCKGA